MQQLITAHKAGVFDPVWQMTWPAPNYSRSRVDRAGRRLGDIKSPFTSELMAAEFPVLDDWRAAHSRPLSAIKNQVQEMASSVQPGSEAVSRLKRHISILKKLIWEPTRLTQMQDVGGCRVVLDSNDAVYDLAGKLTDGLPHDFVDGVDYIKGPTKLGYRSVHLIYKFRPSSREEEPLRGLNVEIQIRTAMQHAWATAVEVLETCTGLAMKSPRGKVDKDYIRYFQLASAIMAENDGTALPPDVPADKDAMTALDAQLRVRNKLAIFGTATLEGISIPPGAEYYLLDLTLGEQARIEVRGFTKNQLEEANAIYAATERNIEQGDLSRQVVLVTASSLGTLRSAYPNYFLNAVAFNTEIDRLLGLS